MHGLHVDAGQSDVKEDAEGIDGPQVGEPVFELEQVRLVNGHFKLCVGAQDLHLQDQNQKSIHLRIHTRVARHRQSIPGRSVCPEKILTSNG